MEATLDEIIDALAEQHAELSGLLASLEDRDWERPSRCEGWSVADVVVHLAQSNELALASLEGRFAEVATPLAVGAKDAPPPPAGAVDDGAARLVAQERGAPPAVVFERWRESADRLEERFRAIDPGQRVDWVAGQMSTRTLATTRLAESWIHTGDITYAFDMPPVPSERLGHIARLAWRMLPYAFAQAGRELAGPVVFELRGPDGAAWRFATPEAEVDAGPAEARPVTTVRGDVTELCLVAARRLDPTDTALQAEGPDADAVLQLIRTYA